MYASLFTLGKAILSYIPPILFVGMRMLIGGIILLSFSRWIKKISFVVQKAHYLWFCALILCHVYLSYTLEYVSMQHLSSVKACLLYNLSPLVTVLLSYIVFKERMTLKKWIGLLIGFFGFIPLLVEQSEPTEIAWHYFITRFISLPELLMLVSVIFACMGWICVKKLTADFKYSYFFVNGVAMFFGGICALLTSFCFETWPAVSVMTSSTMWSYLAAIILIGNVMAYNLHGKLLSIYSATIISFVGSFTPLFAALFGWFFLHEAISLGFWITLALVSFGLFIFYQEELRQGYIKKETT